MPLTVAAVRQEIDAFAPYEGAAGWDPVGLQVGDANATVESIAVCHEVNEAVTAALESAPADLVITYHPLLFQPTRTFTAGPSAEGRAFRLARTGASLVVVHTAFDSAPGGTADALATVVGLTGTTGFLPAWSQDTAKVVTFVPYDHVEPVAEAMTEAGGGVIGNYTGCSFRIEGVGTFQPELGAEPFSGSPGTLNHQPEVRVEMITNAGATDSVIRALLSTHPYETPAYDVYSVESNAGMIGRVGALPGATDLPALAGAIAESLEVTVKTAGQSEKIDRVAVVPGSGGSAIDAAAGAGADVLVTGDVDHHQAQHATDIGLGIVDAGHAPTERPGMRALYDLVSGIGPETIDLTFIDPNPWEEVAWKS